MVLSEIDPEATPGVTSKKGALADFEKNELELRDLQTRLFAEKHRALLVVLQGMDTSGKDGTISHVMGSANPQGIRVASFKAPTPEEKRRGFLWRIRQNLPVPGQIGIFNRSHYEDVVVVKVDHLAPLSVIERRYEVINEFELDLVQNGVRVIKFYLHISFDEQCRRLRERLLRPEKRWKFSENDINERAKWDQYMGAYSAALSRCSTDAAPWFVIPANRKWYRNWAVSRLMIETLSDMDPHYPERTDLDTEALLGRLPCGK